MRKSIRSVVAVVSLVFPALGFSGDEGGAADKEGPFNGLKYRLIGPAAGGRATRVAGVIGDDLTYYAATAAGGVWKSVNGGSKWQSVFDDQPVSSIGSIAVSPSDPNVIWVGSGEANIRGNVGEGNGIYRSTDGGETWKRVWAAEGQIGTMVVHPTDPDVAFAAVLGSPFGPGKNRGVYRTVDGGATWRKVLYKDELTGASDVCMSPSNPRILFAGLWQAQRQPWGLTSGGPGSGLYRSVDGGDSWKQLEGHGLPGGEWGRIGVQVAANQPQRVYAIIEAEAGGLFRSDDGGAKWKLINPSQGIRQRAWYYSTLTVDPTDSDVVWFPQVGMLKTVDGGENIRAAKGGGWDYHDVWIDPGNPARMIVASDAGVSLSRDGGTTWNRPNLPIAQFYHLTVDSRTPYRVLGSLQDFGTVSGPSNSLHSGGILLSDWHSVGGGEAGHVVADPSEPEIVWAGEYLGYISRYDGRTGQAPHVGIYPDNGSGHGAADLRYRFQWTSPIVISPHDPKVVYHAANVLFRTDDGGQSWRAISPDLSRDDVSKQGWAGGPITGDNTGVEYYGTIFAVAESPLEEGLIWAGTDDGLVHLTRDGGEAWTEVTPPQTPEWATIATIEASRWDAGIAYVAVDNHRQDDETPYLFMTEDFGATWSTLSEDLDQEAYLHVVREDSRRRGMLYLGTERGVMVSHDDGGSWNALRLNMPTVAVADLAVAGDDLVVGTLGRSAWILDDLTPVREMSPQIEAEQAHLFEPRPAVRWHNAGRNYGSTAGAGKNPPAGANISYYLAKAPESEITLDIIDESGHVVRRLSSALQPMYTAAYHPDWNPRDKEPKPALSAKPGFNRASWDLNYAQIPWVEGTRIDTGRPKPGPIVAPGTFTLRLTVDGKELSSRVQVLPDPRSSATVAEMKEQLAFALHVREQMSSIVGMAEEIRSVRQQVEERNARRAADPDASEVVRLSTALIADLTAVENAIHNPEAKVDYDVLGGRSGGAKLYSRLSWLFETARAHDGPPTQGMKEVADEMTVEVAAQQAKLDELLGGSLAAVNAAARELEIPYIDRSSKPE